MTQPETRKVRALDVKPYRWSLWCKIGDSEPFANEICNRKWSDDGEHIWFMLDSHNFLKAKPDDELELIPQDPPDFSPEFLEHVDARDEKDMANRPQPKPAPVPCTACGAVLPSSEGVK